MKRRILTDPAIRVGAAVIAVIAFVLALVGLAIVVSTEDEPAPTNVASNWF